MAGQSTALDWKALSFLVVDDEKMIREIVVGLLRNLGAKDITQARNAEHAIAVLEGLQRTPDCLIVDVTMAPLNGIDFALKIRSAELNVPYDIPIVFLTGHSDLHLVAAAKALDANEFILKPASRISLAMRLGRALRGPGCKNPPESYAARLAASRETEPVEKAPAPVSRAEPVSELVDDPWFQALAG